MSVEQSVRDIHDGIINLCKCIIACYLVIASPAFYYRARALPQVLGYIKRNLPRIRLWDLYGINDTTVLCEMETVTVRLQGNDGRIEADNRVSRGICKGYI